jgi:putative phosphonate metabolism protein
MRYGIYYVPARGTPLAEFGSAILGYDLEHGTERERLAVAGLAAGQLAQLTHRARRYGFHATLKAPFALAPGRSRVDVLKLAADIADRCHAVEVSGLQVAMLGDFVAMTLQRACPELNALAAAFVEGLDPLRAVQARDAVKWPAAKLSNRQSALLDAWGYPYVFDQYRFHMTLTDAIPAQVSGAIGDALRRAAAGVAGKPLTIDAVMVVEESEPTAPFRGIARLCLRGHR